jgi:hypothetical protein
MKINHLATMLLFRAEFEEKGFLQSAEEERIESSNSSRLDG